MLKAEQWNVKKLWENLANQILECVAVSELRLIIKLKHKCSTKVKKKKRKEMNLMDILKTNFQQYNFN